MVWDAVAKAAARVDGLPVAPARLADEAVDRFLDRRDARAAGDEAWARIEQRRQTDGPGKVFLSDDLTLADSATQSRIARELTPDPAWLTLAYRVREWTLGSVVSHVRETVQRARRGWADNDAWSAGYHLARTTADMLDHMAEHAHSWPGDGEFAEFEDWTAALRTHAATLRRFACSSDDERSAALDHWHQLATTQGSDAAETEAAFWRLHQLDEEIDAAAIASMHWVADHLRTLWD